MMKYLSIILGLTVLLMSGCGKNMSLSGKITFDDGTPLTSGTIVFECDKTLSRGIIKEDGTFVVGTEKSSNGLPKGKQFTVCITGAYEPLPPNAVMATPVPLIDPKYNTPETSGLTFNSDGKTKTFDIVVKRPDQDTVAKAKKAIMNALRPQKFPGPGAETSSPARQQGGCAIQNNAVRVRIANQQIKNVIVHGDYFFSQSSRSSRSFFRLCLF